MGMGDRNRNLAYLTDCVILCNLFVELRRTGASITNDELQQAGDEHAYVIIGFSNEKED